MAADVISDGGAASAAGTASAADSASAAAAASAAATEPVAADAAPVAPRPAAVVPTSHLARVAELLRAKSPRRVLLGLVGPPGAGKSTLALALAGAFPGVSQVVPMDGFHLAQVELQRLGRAGRKGAPDTFDAAGFAALLQRIRDQEAGDGPVYAPDFRREIEEPVAGAIGVLAETRLVIVEGNYLLLDDRGPWARAAALLDDVWYVEVDDRVRTERLVERHRLFGRSAEEARAWVDRSDADNARLVEATRPRATHRFGWTSDA